MFAQPGQKVLCGTLSEAPGSGQAGLQKTMRIGTFPQRLLVGYYLGMSNHCRVSLALMFVVVTVLSMFMLGCKPPKKVEPVTVRIFRDPASPYASELDRRILDFQATHPRLPNGSAVEVGSFSSSDLKGAVNNMEDPVVDIVILNSPADVINFPALQNELAHAVNVCAAVQACPATVPAFVPSKLQGPRADAANQFVQFLATATPPPPAPPEPAPTQSQPAPAPPPAGH